MFFRIKLSNKYHGRFFDICRQYKCKENRKQYCNKDTEHIWQAIIHKLIYNNIANILVNKI